VTRSLKLLSHRPAFPHISTSCRMSSSVSSSPPSSSDPRVIHVQMTSDNVCPWCYVGKRRLQRAIAKLDPKKVKVEISMKPFFLDPTVTVSVNKLDRYRAKFGAARMEQMIPRMQQIGQEEGINFSYGGNIGNTLASHRLIHYVQTHNTDHDKKQEDKLVDALFNAYFEREQDISSIPVLVSIAESVGLNPSEIEKYLLSREGEAEVKSRVNEAYQSGISGVPHFLIQDKYEVAGAEQPETFLQAFRTLGVYP